MQVEGTRTRARLPEELRLCRNVPLRLQLAEVDRIDKLAARAGTTRSAIVRAMIARGLQEAGR